MSMKFSLERGERLLKDIEKLIYSKSCSVPSFCVLDSNSPEGYCADTSNWAEYRIGDSWCGKDRHRWFRATVLFPETGGETRAVFRLSTGREGQWDATNPQMLFYLDGELLQGLDVNHTEVVLPENVEVCHEVAFLAYSGTVGEELLIKAQTAIKHLSVEGLYYDLLIPLQTARLLQKSDPENSRRILQGTEGALNLLDLREAYSEDFFASIESARQLLKQAFYREVNENTPIVSAVGHTHIDIAWLWTVNQTREKVLRSFSTVLNLMERYPDYKFMSSQPILYQFVKEQHPQLYKKIKQKIAEGRWEADGAMWLEADCNLTSGESFVRQLLKGQKFFSDEFDIESKSLWLPDVFGYSAALPQILKKSGIPYFMTTKISWNQYNQLPNDTFHWRGIDGSEVFVFMPTACNFDKSLGTNISFSETRNTTTYTGIINPNMTLGTYKRFQNKDLIENTLMLFGYGDGGGGPTAEMLESAERLKFGMPGMPRIKLEREGDFFDRTCRNISNLPAMPTWDGELYFEYHRGTYTSMAKNKRNNRKNELLYQKLELLSTFANRFGGDYPEKIIERGWDVLLLNQFHDIIPGTAIEEVYDCTDLEYAEIEQNGRGALERQLIFLSELHGGGKELHVLVFNVQGYVRDDVVTVRLPKDIRATGMRDQDGAISPVQYIESDVCIFFARGLPPAGYRVFAVVTEELPCIVPSFALPVYENDFYSVTIERDMTISSLIEKTTNRELIAAGGAGNRLMSYEDRPMDWDNWDVDAYYRQKPYPANTFTDIKVVEKGVVRVVLEGTAQFAESTVTQRMILYHDLPRIDICHVTDWRAHNVLLKTEFDVDVYSTKATYEIQFGNLERETTSNTSWDTAKFEVCAHKWVDLSDNGSGLSLLNDCKYGHSIKNSRMELTLVKAGTYPNPNADIGKQTYTYSLYPHSGQWHQAQTIEQAYNLNVPMESVVFCGGMGSLPQELSLVRTNRGDCFVEAFKQAEDKNGSILRVYENKNMKSDVVFTFGVPIEMVYECDMMERNLTEFAVNQNSFQDTLKSFEIKTYRIIWK